VEFFVGFTRSFMTEKSEKFLSLDEFKERVYKHIGMLESIEDEAFKLAEKSVNFGCFGFLFGGFAHSMLRSANKMYRRQMKIDEPSKKADEILAQKEIKDLLCEKLDATVVLPIDAAYKLTPVLYGLALENEEKVPFDSMLFAIICRKITKQGVESFCGGTSTKAEKDKSGKATGKKRTND